MIELRHRDETLPGPRAAPLAQGARRPLIVMKFGGTSVAGVARMREVARIACERRDAGDDVVVVVSAMSGETDRLLALAREVAPSPDSRETDVIASTGEQVSCALTAMCLKARGARATSFLGYQIPMITDGRHTTARIRTIGRDRLRAAIAEGCIPVVAGFQGVDDALDITTLGRGGSDATAVALAAALGADACEIYSDVDGVYSADPRICPSARKLAAIPYEEMLELASLGAKVLQARSVEIAMKHDVAVHARSSFTSEEGTWIVGRERAVEAVGLAGIACARGLARVDVSFGSPRAPALSEVLAILGELHVCADMLGHVQPASPGDEGRADLAFTVAASELPRLLPALERSAGGAAVRVTEGLAKVSVVGTGIRSDPGLVALACASLSRHGIAVSGIAVTELRMSCLVEEARADQAVRALHDSLGLSRGAPS